MSVVVVALTAFKVFRSLMSLLTAIPVKMDESFLPLSARFMFLFPIIGALIGLMAGVYSFFAYNFLLFLFSFLDSTVFMGFQTIFSGVLAKVLASVMTLAFLLVITGLQHMDGLIDMGNALSVRKATVEERKKIAHAWMVTRTGAMIAILVSFGTVLLIFLLRPETIILSLMVAETSAKLAMVTCAWEGYSPQKGVGSIFIDAMRRKHGLYLVALVISVPLSFLLLGLGGLLAVTSGIIVAAIMIVLSKKIFGGVTGDLFGATNEISRMIALFALVL